MKLRTLLIVGIVTLFALGAQADDKAAAAKRADIKKLMDATGAGKLGIQVMNQMLSVFKKQASGVPDKFWDDFMAKVNPDELVEMCIPSYEKHFTHAEIKELLAFYETPLGKKMIKTQPLIMQECMVAGQKWGAKIGQQVVRDLQKQGY